MYNFDSLRTIGKINGRFSKSELGIIANRPRRGKKRHTLLEDLGLQIASLLSCFLRLYRQSRPVCAASRPWLASASVGARPHRERLRRAKCNNHRSCSPYFYPEREKVRVRSNEHGRACVRGSALSAIKSVRVGVQPG